MSRIITNFCIRASKPADRFGAQGAQFLGRLMLSAVKLPEQAKIDMYVELELVVIRPLNACCSPIPQSLQSFGQWPGSELCGGN